MDSLRSQALKSLGNKCVRCGIDDPRVLHIDHVIPVSQTPGRKRFHRNLMYKYIIVGYKRRAYQILCANCHMIKTAEDKLYSGSDGPQLRREERKKLRNQKLLADIEVLRKQPRYAKMFGSADRQSAVITKDIG